VIQLGEMIVSKTLSGQTIKKNRKAARGIIKDGNKLYMIHCAYYNDYTFPGGGVEEGEDPILALKRECMEEAGVIIKNIRPFYKIVEKREVDNDSYLIHESFFYLCDVASYCEPKLESYEIEYGYSALWMDIDEAIKLDNERMHALKDTDYKGVLERELRILYELKKY
jgi:8-oxo-dGTP pyrophosphatase MutT (NUDIX family)